MRRISEFIMGQRFFYFSYVFLFVISIISVPALLYDKNYKKLIIFMLIFLFLISIIVFLKLFFAKNATGFCVNETSIVLNYCEGNQKSIKFTDITKIHISPNRYIFVLGNKKFFLSRIIAPFKVEKDINPVIYQISKNYNIKLIYV